MKSRILAILSRLDLNLPSTGSFVLFRTSLILIASIGWKIFGTHDANLAASIYILGLPFLLQGISKRIFRVILTRKKIPEKKSLRRPSKAGEILCFFLTLAADSVFAYAVLGRDHWSGGLIYIIILLLLTFRLLEPKLWHWHVLKRKSLRSPSFFEIAMRPSVLYDSHRRILQSKGFKNAAVNLEFLDPLLNSGFDFLSLDRRNHVIPLRYLIERGSPEILRRVVLQGVVGTNYRFEGESKLTGGYPILFAAIASRRIENVKFLVENGSDIYCEYLGHTSLDWAARCGAQEIAEYLKQHGAVIQSSERNGSNCQSDEVYNEEEFLENSDGNSERASEAGPEDGHNTDQSYNHERNQACLILGLESTATAAEIKDAYLTLAKMYHPDLHMTEPATKRKIVENKMKQIASAYEILRKSAS